MLLVSLAFALDCGAVADAEVCEAVNDMVTQVNTQRGLTILGDTATGKKNSLSIYNQLVEVKSVANSGGCTVEGWGSGTYTRFNKRAFGSSEDFNETIVASIEASFAADRTWGGTWDPGTGAVAIGDDFGHQNRDFQVAANLGVDGFIVGRWIRETGKRGAFVTLYGTCASTPANQVFNDWFGRDVLYQGPPPVPTWPETTRVLGCDRAGNGYRFYDDVDYLEQSSGTYTLPGINIVGCNGLAYDPDTELVYIVVRDDSSTRHLGTLDTDTGQVSSQGVLTDKVASITFDINGQLYAVIGDGGTAASALMTVDKETAVMTLVGAMGAGNDGEAIAYNPDNNLLYHASGRFSGAISEYVDPVTAVSVTGAVSPVQTNPNGDEEILGGTWIGDRFLLVNLDGEFVEATESGGIFTRTVIGPAGSANKGITAVP